jgi:hypothetical protein
MGAVVPKKIYIQEIFHLYSRGGFIAVSILIPINPMKI